MEWVKTSERIPPVGIYFAKYNGDHALFQVHDGGFRIILYDGKLIDLPMMLYVKWLDEQ
jgi:hypothetical protein